MKKKKLSKKKRLVLKKIIKNKDLREWLSIIIAFASLLLLIYVTFRGVDELQNINLNLNEINEITLANSLKVRNITGNCPDGTSGGTTISDEGIIFSCNQPPES